MSKGKQTAEGKQTADLPKNHNFSYLTTLYSMGVVKYVEFLNFLNFGGDDEKRLVGLRQASGRRQKLTFTLDDIFSV